MLFEAPEFTFRLKKRIDPSTQAKSEEVEYAGLARKKNISVKN